MASSAGLMRAFAMLDTIGIKGGPTEAEARLTMGALWLDLLDDVSDEALIAAVKTWLRRPDSIWWPTPGQLLACTPVAQRAALDDDAEIRCTQALRMVARFGRDGRPNALDVDPDVHAAMCAGIEAMGGWREVANGPEVTPGWDRKRFVDAYRASRAKGRLAIEERKVLSLADRRKP